MTESHPKALLWALRIASKEKKSSDVAVSDCESLVRGSIGASEDERDAALGAYVAWAMVTPQPGWIDLVGIEDEPLFFTDGKTEYWFPVAV